MLNIPDSVKSLFKQDGVRKNFRVHFPNGELNDLTNDNVVQESVRFTESICSQDVFKFGLTEASVIEFETVGVANMYGMTIECACEIDCTSLTAAEVEAIEAGTWDGEYIAAASSDLGYAIFRVPYGTFRVESCPRDHQAMTHRRVKAYSESNSDTNQFESAKDAMMVPSKLYTPNTQALVMGQIARHSPQTLLANGYTTQMVNLTTASAPWTTKSYPLKTVDGDDAHATFYVYSATAGGETTDNPVNSYNLWSLDFNEIGFDDDADFSAAVAALENWGIDAQASGYNSLLDIVKDAFPKTFMPCWWYGIQTYEASSGGTVISQSYSNNYLIPINEGEIVYPYRNNVRPRIVHFRLAQILFRNESTSETDRATIFSRGGSYPIATVYTPPVQTNRYPLAIEPTLEVEKSYSGYNRVTYYSFADAFSAVDIANGFLELNAQFASNDRNGGFAIKRLDNTSPVAIAPGDYSQMWWDEYEVEPVGSIRYAYTDEAGEEQTVNYEFGDGKSIYDMTDNAVIKMLRDATPQTIETKLDADFLPYLGAVNFVPVDLTMKALPYIEAGDAISVTAQDGTVCSSYALRQEIDGIQALEAQIDSQSGLIIDNEGA